MRIKWVRDSKTLIASCISVAAICVALTRETQNCDVGLILEEGEDIDELASEREREGENDPSYKLVTASPSYFGDGLVCVNGGGVFYELVVRRFEHFTI